MPNPYRIRIAKFTVLTVTILSLLTMGCGSNEQPDVQATVEAIVEATITADSSTSVSGFHTTEQLGEWTKFSHDQLGFSLSMPKDWVEDTEFGKEMLQEELGYLAPTVVFFGGKPSPGGFSPNVLFLQVGVPRHAELKSLAQGEINQLKLDIPDLEVILEEAITVADHSAYLIKSLDTKNHLKFVHIIIIRERREWLLQCTLDTLSEETVVEEEKCTETLKSLKFH